MSGDASTKHIFHAFNGYVAQVTGRTSCLFWTDDPNDRAINWDISLAYPVDLAMSVSAARAGRIPWEDVQVDDHSMNGGLTSIGPLFPGGSVIGGVWLHAYYMAKIGLTTASKPQHAFDYELRSVLYAGDKVYGDRRFHGFHAEIEGQPALAASAQVTRLKVWNAGTGMDGGPAMAWWFDLNDVSDTSESTVGARGAGSLYIDADKRLLAFSGGGGGGPKLPKSLGY